MKPTLARVLVLAFTFTSPAGAENSATDIGQSDLKRLIDDRADVLLLDVRTPDEFAAGHIPGSMNVPVKALDEQIDPIREKAASGVVVYCEAGPRALAAQKMLVEAGVRNVLHLQGDMRGWRTQGLPVEPLP